MVRVNDSPFLYPTDAWGRTHKQGPPRRYLLGRTAIDLAPVGFLPPETRALLGLSDWAIENTPKNLKLSEVLRSLP